MLSRMEEAIVALDLVSLLGFGAAFIVALRGQSEHIDRAARVFLLVCMGLYFFVNISNLLEHGGVTEYFDAYEDYLEILFIQFFLFFLYSVKVHRELERSRRAGASLRQSEERIRASLREKEVLLKEIHHRVKNNLAVVSALLSLQAKRSADKGVRDAAETSKNRIKAMALIHEQLYQSEDLASASFEEYARELAGYIIASHDLSGKVQLEVEAERLTLGMDTLIPCGLILNELVTNSLKHAFEGTPEPRISISLRARDGMAALSCSDNGRRASRRH